MTLQAITFETSFVCLIGDSETIWHNQSPAQSGGRRLCPFLLGGSQQERGGQGLYRWTPPPLGTPLNSVSQTLSLEIPRAHWFFRLPRSQQKSLAPLYEFVHSFQATCKVFQSHCSQHVKLPSRGFLASYTTNIPRQCGLSGSSAIVLAALDCLIRFYHVSNMWVLMISFDQPLRLHIKPVTSISEHEM